LDETVSDGHTNQETPEYQSVMFLFEASCSVRIFQAKNMKSLLKTRQFVVNHRSFTLSKLT
jgi:hypothetical protein